jgi:hypothetical protein
MAQLNPSNIQNGNIIQANDVLQLYDALTSGGGYNVSISGSLTGSASTATTANTANITLASQTFYIDLEGTGNTIFRSITGISSPLSSGTVTVDISEILPPPTQLGVDIFITASPSGSLSSPIQVDLGGEGGDITFTTQDTESTARVLFTGWIV